MPLGTRIFLGTALVVVAVLGSALLVTKLRADAAADAASARAVGSTAATIRDALQGRSGTLRRLTEALVEVPAYVSRIGEALRTGDRANLLDQADELRAQTGADWVLITDGAGVPGVDDGAGASTRTSRRAVGRALEGSPPGALASPGAGERSCRPWACRWRPGLDRALRWWAALQLDSALAGQLRRHTDGEIVFFSLDTLGVPQVAVSTLPRDSVARAVRGAPIEGGDSIAPRFRLVANGVQYEGAAEPLRSADGVPLGGFIGLHSRDAYLAPSRQLGRTIGWVFVVGLLLALGFSVLMARRISRPLHQLVAATRRVSEGQYTGRIEIGGGDEIGELAGAFDQMVEELREKDRLVEYLKTGGQRGGGAAWATVVSARRPAPGRLRFAGRYDILDVLGSGGWCGPPRVRSRGGRAGGDQGTPARAQGASIRRLLERFSGSSGWPPHHPPERGPHLRPGRGGWGLLHHHGLVRTAPRWRR
jgi:HAMP domain-containing protein